MVTLVSPSSISASRSVSTKPSLIPSSSSSHCTRGSGSIFGLGLGSTVSVSVVLLEHPNSEVTRAITVCGVAMFWYIVGSTMGLSAASSAGVAYHCTVRLGSPPVTRMFWVVRSKVEISSSGALPCSSSSQRAISSGPLLAGTGSTIRVRVTMS